MSTDQPQVDVAGTDTAYDLDAHDRGTDAGRFDRVHGEQHMADELPIVWAQQANDYRAGYDQGYRRPLPRPVPLAPGEEPF